jgi:hypothetical protein
MVCRLSRSSKGVCGTVGADETMRKGIFVLLGTGRICSSMRVVRRICIWIVRTDRAFVRLPWFGFAGVVEVGERMLFFWFDLR